MPVADVPDAPDALVERMRCNTDPWTWPPSLADCLAAADRLDAWRAEGGRMALELEQVNARLAEAERLLKDSLRAVPPREAIEAFLAGSATPPEAPQQTALARLAAKLHEQEDNTLLLWPDANTTMVVAAWTDGETGTQVTRSAPTPEAAFLALAGAVAPTEADRP